MAQLKDVANFFIDLAQDQSTNHTGDLMTNLRLQKLLKNDQSAAKAGRVCPPAMAIRRAEQAHYGARIQTPLIAAAGF